MKVFKHLVIALTIAAGAWSLAPSPALASVVSQNLNFSEQNQSMWGPGAATQFSYNNFLGAQWNNKTVSVGGFTGGTTAVLNPAWVAWHLCPFLCGSQPNKYSYIDTKTGAQVWATTSGKVGFNVGFSMNSGSVNSSADYTTQVNLPSSVDAGQLVSLNTTGGSKMTNGGLNSQFPTVTASLSAVVQASASVGASACLLGACKSGSYYTGVLGGTQPLISFNNGGLTLFGGQGNYLHDIISAAANYEGHPLPTGLPASFDIPAPSVSAGGLGISSTLGTVTVNYPDPNVTGTVNSAGTQISGSATSSPAITLDANVTNLIATAFDAPGLLGGSVDMGGGFSLDYHLVNVQAGPTISLTQNFDLTPSLYVDLAFSKPVNVTGYGSVTHLDHVNWNNLPSMVFGLGDTTITPTFYLAAGLGGTNTADLLNQLLLTVGGNITADLLNATINTPFNSSLTIGVPQLLNQQFNLFNTPPVFSKTFALAGFNSIVGNSFTISAHAVPAPDTIILLLGSILVLAALQRRRRLA